MSYALSRHSQKQAIIGTISALVKQLQQLAPHPDRPNYSGPLFLSGNPNFKAANDQDGMLGSMLIEGMLGVAFGEACSEMTNGLSDHIDLNNAMELYSEFITDVEKEDTQKIAAHGQGTMARMSGTSISSSFNLRSTLSEGMQLFLEDLPKRMTIERSLAYYARQLALLDAPAPHYSMPKPQYAA